MTLTPRQKAMRSQLIHTRDQDRELFEGLVKSVLYDPENPKGTKEQDTKALFHIHIEEEAHPSG